jgi:uncharacterized protein YceK
MAAIENDEYALKVYRERWGVKPPPKPKVDIFFSFFLDTALLFPIVLPVVLYEVVFR